LLKILLMDLPLRAFSRFSSNNGRLPIEFHLIGLLQCFGMPGHFQAVSLFTQLRKCPMLPYCALDINPI
jgi:hypothetical protein